MSCDMSCSPQSRHGSPMAPFPSQRGHGLRTTRSAGGPTQAFAGKLQYGVLVRHYRRHRARAVLFVTSTGAKLVLSDGALAHPAPVSDARQVPLDHGWRRTTRNVGGTSGPIGAGRGGDVNRAHHGRARHLDGGGADGRGDVFDAAKSVQQKPHHVLLYLRWSNATARPVHRSARRSRRKPLDMRAQLRLSDSSRCLPGSPSRTSAAGGGRAGAFESAVIGELDGDACTVSSASSRVKRLASPCRRGRSSCRRRTARGPTRRTRRARLSAPRTIRGGRARALLVEASASSRTSLNLLPRWPS